MARTGRKNADDRLILELAAGKTAVEAAEAAGIGARTVYRRLGDSGFRERLAEARKGLVSRALEKLAESSGAAVETLVALLKSESDAIKLGAARSILDCGLKLRQAVELEERVRKLEQPDEGKAHARDQRPFGAA